MEQQLGHGALCCLGSLLDAETSHSPQQQENQLWEPYNVLPHSHT